MARDYAIFRIKDKRIVADRLPLSEDSDLTRVLSAPTSAGFEMPVAHARTPKDWSSLITRLDKAVAVLDDSLPQPLWGGYITDIPTQGSSKVTLETTTFEGLLSNGAFVGDMRFDSDDVISVAARQIGGYLESQGIGFIDEFDCPPSGVLITKYFDDSSDTTIADALEQLGIKWSIRLRWTDATKSAFKIVFWARIASHGFTTTPKIAFELDGPVRNVASFDYAAPQNGEEAATRLIVIGEGSGDARARSAPLTDTEREVYTPRREVRLHVPGLFTVEDCNYYAQAVKDDYFARRDAVTLTAIDNGATSFADIADMGMSAFTNIHRAEMDFDDVTQVVGWSVGKSTRIFKPTLVKLSSGSVRFPRSVDPAVSPKRDEIKKDVRRALTRDPLVNGYNWPTPNGGYTKMGPEGFGAYDADGNALGGFDSTGSGFGNIGSGGGGGLTRMQVASYDAISFDTTVHPIGEPDGSITEAINSSGRVLVTGDYVVLGENTNAEGKAIITSRERADYGDPTTYAKYRVHEDYPFSTGSYSVAVGSSFTDAGNAFGGGNGCIVIDHPTTTGMLYNMYNPVSGGAGKLTPPSGFGWLNYATSVFGGKGFKWFLDASGFPRLFVKDGTAAGGWSQILGMPTTPDRFIAGTWDSTSFGKEVFAKPTAATIRVSSGSFRQGFQKYYVPIELAVYRLDAAGTGMTPVRTYQAELTVPDGTNATAPAMNSAGIAPKVTIYSSGPHVFMVASATAITTAYSRGSTSNESLWYVNLDGPTPTQLTELYTGTESIKNYLGDTVTAVRVSDDAAMYGVKTGTSSGSYRIPQGVLYVRKINDASANNVVFHNSIVGPNCFPQRDRLTDRYFVVGTKLVTSQPYESQDVHASLVWEVYASNGSVGIAVQPGAGGPNLKGSGFTPRPSQNADNGILVNWYHDESPTGRELQLLIPDDSVWP